MQADKKKGVNLSTAAVEPTADNYSQDANSFIFNNQDLVSEDWSRQNRQNSLSMCEVKISQLPDITESLLPIWDEMVDSNKHKCVICGKKQMNLEKYDDHMTFKHQVSLQDPILGEYEAARAVFEYDHESCAPEDREKAYWDYNSDTGKRYSAGESGEESNTNDASDHKPMQITSGKNSSSGSSSEDSAGRYRRMRTKTKKINERFPTNGIFGTI